jgi:hypothetical protein
MPMLADLDEFVTDHRPHGALTAEVTSEESDPTDLPHPP